MAIPRVATKKAWGEAVGPLGFPMRDEAAKRLQKLLGEVPEELKEISAEIDGESVEGYGRLEVFSKQEPDVNDHDEISMVTTSSRDGDGEVVVQDGIKWGTFKLNPVVGYAHDYRNLPVGRAMWWKRVRSGNPKRDGWLAATRYTSAPDGHTNWFPDAVLHLIRELVLRGKSIGFVPLEGRRPTEADVKRDPRMAEVRFVLSKIEVVEYSVVGVPANPHALVQTVGKSIDSLDRAAFLEMFGVMVPDELKTLSELLEEDDDREELIIGAVGGVNKAKAEKAAEDIVRQAKLREDPIKTALSELNESLELELGGV